MRPGDVLAGYIVDRVLGQGGSSAVYLAHVESDPHNAFALKVLHEDHAGAEALERLQHEFSVADGLRHEHIVRVCGHGPSWLAMEYVDGGNSIALESLADRLVALAQVADALDYAHGQGISHCDVKPTNILVFKDFVRRGAVLIDFGIASGIDGRSAVASCQPAYFQGSLPFVAPELLIGRAPSAQTDEYELACTAVSLITGAPPFPATTAVQLMDAHLRRPPPRISRRMSWIPGAFDSILSKAMAKRPEDRYQTCSEFVHLITRVLS
nr:serine/threonine-protein kinase [Mycolicibacterium sphagni]